MLKHIKTRQNLSSSKPAGKEDSEAPKKYDVSNPKFGLNGFSDLGRDNQRLRVSASHWLTLESGVIMLYIKSGQIMATSHDLTPKGS